MKTTYRKYLNKNVKLTRVTGMESIGYIHAINHIGDIFMYHNTKGKGSAIAKRKGISFSNNSWIQVKNIRNIEVIDLFDI